MAASPSLIFLTLFSLSSFSLQQPQPATLPLPPSEQEAVYLALEALNPTLPWRSLYPDDLCLLPPHGLFCDLFLYDAVSTPHVVELNFGAVSDYSPNPPCSPTATFPPSLPFPRLRKLFFYNCFTLNPVHLPGSDYFSGSDLQELVFIHNPSLSGSLDSTIGNFTSLRRLIITGSNVSGVLAPEITDLPSLEQLTVSGNNLAGGIPPAIGNLHSLRVLDLSNNGFSGSIPESLGRLGNLLKLDLNSNGFSGKIPESLKNLQGLEFLDLSNNELGSYGVPLFLGEMPGLRELHLSGNRLGGAIPEIWENLGGILGIGLSGLGLVGNIPASMGAFLENAVYIGLNNNSLEGCVPMEFGTLQKVHELNLEHNRLAGRLPFSDGFVARLGGKLKLRGNPELCVSCSGIEVSHFAPVNGAAPSPSLDSISWYLVRVVVGFWSFCLCPTLVT